MYFKIVGKGEDGNPDESTEPADLYSYRQQVSGAKIDKGIINYLFYGT